MAEAVIMPKTNMDMEEGTIICWLKEVGEKIEKGDSIAEIETGKAAMELEAEAEGVLLMQVASAGDTIPVTETIAWIGEEGEDIPDTPSAALAEEPAETATPQEPAATPAKKPAIADNGRIKATPAARTTAQEKDLNLADIPASGKQDEIVKNDVLEYARNNKATPLARKLSQESGVKLDSIGGEGRVFSRDVERHLAQLSQSAGEESLREDQIVPLTTMQKITGKRMMQSHTEIPVVTINTKADVTRLLAIRQELNNNGDYKYTINDFVLKATALALSDNPRINSTLAPEGDRLIYKGSINIGMAVATPKGLLVPVINNADMLNLRSISEVAANLASQGREGTMPMEALEGGTFTISNIGMFGVTSFSPIINQPEAAILGVCAIEDQLKLIDNEVKQHKMMGLSLTFDHRIVDGAESSKFIKSIKDYLENPLSIMAK